MSVFERQSANKKDFETRFLLRPKLFFKDDSYYAVNTFLPFTCVDVCSRERRGDGDRAGAEFPSVMYLNSVYKH